MNAILELPEVTRPEMLVALRESIEHWRRLATGNRQSGETHLSWHCALCRIYAIGRESCQGCPVMAFTRKPQCEGSPWADAHEAWADGGYDSPEFRQDALEMLQFLERLLERKVQVSPNQ